MAVDEKKIKVEFRGREICVYLKGGKIHHEEGAKNYHHTERGWERNHPKAENRKYRFYKEELSVTRENRKYGFCKEELSVTREKKG